MENINKVYGRIYIITNSINDKCYVGQTVQTIEERYKGHYKDSKYSKNKIVIDRAISKYGFENFKIKEIAVAYTQEQLNFSEGFYINSFNTLTPNGYNVKEIIDGKGKLSEETKEKLRIIANAPERFKINSENGIKSRGKSLKNSTSKYAGVSVRNKKYIVNICYLNNGIHLGTYDSEIDAAKAYDIAAIKYYGQDCNLNFHELREDYINNKIHIEKRKKNKAIEKYITFIKDRNNWRFKWFSKELNRNTSKYLKTLEETINFRNQKILDQDYLEFKGK